MTHPHLSIAIRAVADIVLSHGREIKRKKQKEEREKLA